ncbi:hypothetical protein B0H11DRAFT_1916306 [Mycena galericulata]|nr:hypothetical protein B0H11DRAFT_1916306 [Mycena galericulata]
MPAIHYRPRQLSGDPLSGIIPTGAVTTTAVATGSDVVATTPATLTDPLAGLSSVIASILPTTSSAEVTTYTHHDLFNLYYNRKTPRMTMAPKLTGGNFKTTTPTTTLAPTTITNTLTSTPTLASASASASSSPTPTTSGSSIAAAIVGSLVGALSLCLIIAFFLRRWNRNRSRARARESINFAPDEFRSSAMPAEQKQYGEQKVDNNATMGAYQQYPVAGYSPSVAYPPAEYSQQQQQPYIYSPHPQRLGYPSAAQQIAYEYQGTQEPQYRFDQRRASQAHPPSLQPGAYHPAANYADAYGGM